MHQFRLGRLWGIPINLNASFFVLLLTFLLWQGWRGLGMLGAVFVGVLLHEMGHALVARRLGIPIIGIDLHFFGGAARLAQMPGPPRQEIAVAVAGPLVSFALAGLCYLFYRFTGNPTFVSFGVINLVLGGFNLLPALPMDGGRILRAVLTGRYGRLKATVIAVKIARGVALGLGLWGFWQQHFFLVGLAVMLWFMAGAELLAARFMSFAETLQGGIPPSYSSRSWEPSPGEVEVLDQHGRPIRRG